MAIGSPQWMYASGEAYELEQSLKFEDGRSAYLKKTFASAGNRRTWTWSAWIKRSNSSATHMLFFTAVAGDLTEDDHFGIRLDSGASSNIVLTWGDGNTAVTNAIFRDSSAWMHIVVAIDTTQGTDTNRVKVYVNGTQQTFSSTDLPSQNFEYGINKAQEHNLGSRVIYGSSANYYDGYITEVNFIDGQALTPADFGETGDYGEWKPIEYSGSYGTNGFYLNFSGGGVMSATGGNSTATDGDYKVASFTSSGTFTPSADGYVEYLVIGGGGSGGGAPSRYGSGGGAGGYRTGYLPVTGGTGYTVTVGAGGVVSSNVADKGDDSVFGSITAAGGGRGTTTKNGTNDYTTDINGGSGGGAGTYGQGTAGTGISGQGNNGGAGSSAAATGGGGGAGGVGGTAEAAGSEIGGLGGAGLASSITGSSVTRAGGGGGGAWGGTNHAGSAGGSGGGGRGNGNGNAGTDGTANTGSGGGGGGYGHNGGNGGSGIVIIRYKFQ
jgi:hypothetical protein